MAPGSVHLLAASGQLGYGFTVEALRRALAGGVHAIGCDGGSMDPGPYYLGSGEAFVSETALRRDLALLLEAGASAGVPLLVGSAGGGGGVPHVEHVCALVREIAREQGLRRRLAVIHAEPSRDLVEERLRAGRVHPLGPVPAIDAGDVRRAHRIVAMMGVEPFQRAVEAGADVVIAGRSSDAAIFAAPALARGADPGLAWHLAKIVECGAQVIEPRTGQDCVVGHIHDDHFLVEPGHPDKRCTRRRVAAHTLYETPDPVRITEPGGVLDVSGATFEQADERTVRVAGSRFEKAPRYTVKLEGVEHIGHRMAFLAGVRDPDLVRGIDGFLDDARDRVAEQAAALGIDAADYDLRVRVYGRDAVMGAREPERGALPHEVGLLAEVVAPDEAAARAVIARARYVLLHTDFPGRKCISGNLAIPFSPSDLSLGPAYRFSVWHTMELDDPHEAFPVAFEDVGR